MTRQEIERIFKRREIAWKDHDAHSLALYHADNSMVISPTHGELHGRPAIEEVYTMWFTAFPDLRFTQDHLLVENDRAVVFFRSSGTHVKPFGNMPPTGRKLEVQGVSLITFKDGLIVHETRYYDATALLVQIGALKARPA
jgi:steroid delta-isomerase-like uncharacterized protein